MKEREKFGSRLGFILVSAGCAIGLGNVWKFPYMCGQYGGAVFILIYLKGYYDMFYPKGMNYFIPWMCVAVAFLALVGYFRFSMNNKNKELK